MKTTKDEIRMTALRLFAERGFDAVSTGMLAEQLGITKGALYRHFPSKQAIFDSIFEKMVELDGERARADRVPAGERTDSPEEYPGTKLSDLCEYVVHQFEFWTENEFAACFRRLVTLEQYKTPEMRKLYQDVIAGGPARYSEELLASMLEDGELNAEAAAYGPRMLALELFAPLSLMLQLRDGGEEPDKLKSELREITGAFRRRFCRPREKALIRREEAADHRIVEELVRDSFWNVYRPGCTEHFVLRALRQSPDFVPELDLVLELDGTIAGQIAFVRSTLQLDDGGSLPVLTLGPVSVAAGKKRRGWGLLLLKEALERAAELGFGAVVLEGNPAFYGKCGFLPAGSRNIRYHGAPAEDFFLCRELIPGYLKGISGNYEVPEIYFAAETNPEAFKQYDAGFPEREKLVLPGQLSSVPAGEVL